MAKKAMIEREKKRQKLVDKFAAKRADLKAIARMYGIVDVSECICFAKARYHFFSKHINPKIIIQR